MTFDANDTFSATKIEIVNSQAQLKLDGTYPTDNPTITKATVINLNTLEGFFENATKPSGTEVKYILKDGSTDKYFNTTTETWVESDGTYTQSNTAVEIDNNRRSFRSEGAISLVTFLHSDDGSATPAV